MSETCPAGLKAGDLPVEGVMGIQEPPTATDGTKISHETNAPVGGTDGLAMNGSVSSLIPLLGEMLCELKAIIKRQNEIDASMQLLLKTVLQKDTHQKEEDQAPNTHSGMTRGEKCVEDQHGSKKTDWENIKLEPFGGNDDDTYVNISEDEGYFHDMGSKKNKMKLPIEETHATQDTAKVQHFVKTEHDMYYNMVNGPDLKVLASNFKRGISFTEGTTGKDNIGNEKTFMQPRKLSFTPTRALKKQKIIDLDPPKKCTPKKKVGLQESNAKGSSPTEKMAMVSTYSRTSNQKAIVRTKFMPTPDMKLTPQEVHLSLYIFQVEGDLSESLTRIGTTIGSRMVLETLCPDKVIDREIVRLLAHKISYTQRKMQMETVWCLPPSFVCGVISRMVHFVPYLASEYSPYYDLQGWDITQPQGLPSCQNG
ncbi:FAR1 DNA-binding domain protein [Sesbania bispinosa]|nr:FAR1 DNA-binding domain protein [Sesbania bispinosa]